MDCNCKTDILLEFIFCYIKKIALEVLCARIEPCKSSPRKNCLQWHVLHTKYHCGGRVWHIISKRIVLLGDDYYKEPFLKAVWYDTNSHKTVTARTVIQLEPEFSGSRFGLFKSLLYTYLDKGNKGSGNGIVIHAELIPLQCWHFGCCQSTFFILTTISNFVPKFTNLVTPPLTGTIAISTSFRAGTPFWEISDECPLKSLKVSKMEVNQFKLIHLHFAHF